MSLAKEAQNLVESIGWREGYEDTKLSDDVWKLSKLVKKLASKIEEQENQITLLIEQLETPDWKERR